jgi:hypothetical protein
LVSLGFQFLYQTIAPESLRKSYSINWSNIKNKISLDNQLDMRRRINKVSEKRLPIRLQLDFFYHAFACFALTQEEATFIDSVKNLIRLPGRTKAELNLYKAVLDLVQINICWQKGAITMASEKILNFLAKLEHDLYEDKM